MPRVEFFQDRETRDLVLCQFAHCAELGIGDSPTGPLVRLPLDEFVRNAADIVTREFGEFYTRDYRAKSELYELMTLRERRKFFANHTVVGVAWPIKSEPARVYIGEGHDTYETIGYPFDKGAFSELVRRALAAALEKHGDKGRKKHR